MERVEIAESNCRGCNGPFTYERTGPGQNSHYCDECKDKLLNMQFRPTSHAIHGVSDGPGSCSNELIFDRPNPKKDIPITVKKMEEAGQLKDPSMMAIAKMKMEKAKNMPVEKVDYQKGGHPLE